MSLGLEVHLATSTVASVKDQLPSKNRLHWPTNSDLSEICCLTMVAKHSVAMQFANLIGLLLCNKS